MSIRIYLAAWGSACLLASGVAFAQQAGNTSGPATGNNVEPSTAIQKNNSAGSGSQDQGASAAAAGAPGAEAKPGTEGGHVPAGKGPGKGAPETGNYPGTGNSQ
jgi:hypothetical protein